MNNKTKQAYNIWATTYDDDPNPQILLEHDDVIEIISPKPGEYILDAACGTGKYAVEFSQLGAKVLGADFSEKMLEKAKAKKSHVDFQLVDLSKKFPFENDTFDKINLGQAIKHFKDADLLLQEFYRCLKPKGIVVISVSHPDMVWDKYELKYSITEVADLKKSADQYPRSLEDYRNIFINSKFTIEEERSLKVNKKIKHLLTEDSYEVVKGMKQIIIFKLVKI